MKQRRCVQFFQEIQFLVNNYYTWSCGSPEVVVVVDTKRRVPELTGVDDLTSTSTSTFLHYRPADGATETGISSTEDSNDLIMNNLTWDN